MLGCCDDVRPRTMPIFIPISGMQIERIAKTRDLRLEKLVLSLRHWSHVRKKKHWKDKQVRSGRRRAGGKAVIAETGDEDQNFTHHLSTDCQ